MSVPMPVGLEVRSCVADLLADHAYFLDHLKLDEWLGLFVEEAAYRVIPRENLAQGLPAALILCENKNMLRDRVAALRGAIVYNIHVSRHLVGTARMEQCGADEFLVQAPYAVYQTNQDGQSRLFCVGSYRDRIVVTQAGYRFKEKIAILDTASVPTLLAVPL